MIVENMVNIHLNIEMIPHVFPATNSQDQVARYGEEWNGPHLHCCRWGRCHYSVIVRSIYSPSWRRSHGRSRATWLQPFLQSGIPVLAWWDLWSAGATSPLRRAMTTTKMMQGYVFEVKRIEFGHFEILNILNDFESLAEDHSFHRIHQFGDNIISPLLK